jgi:hypothetical protein
MTNESKSKGGPGGCPLAQCHLRKDELYDEDLYKHLLSYHDKKDLVEHIYNKTAMRRSRKEVILDK